MRFIISFENCKDRRTIASLLILKFNGVQLKCDKKCTVYILFIDKRFSGISNLCEFPSENFEFLRFFQLTSMERFRPVSVTYFKNIEPVHVDLCADP